MNSESSKTVNMTPSNDKHSRFGRKITPKKKFNPYSSSEDEMESPNKATPSCGSKKVVYDSSITSPSKVDKSFKKSCDDKSTPGNRKKLIENTIKELPKTPYSLRQRLKDKIQNEVEEDEDVLFDVSEESQWEETESESSESEEDIEEQTAPSNLPKTVKPEISTERKSHYVCCSSDYLDKSSRKSVTSSKRLKKLEDASQLSKILSSYTQPHSSQIEALVKQNESLYYKWMYALSKNYNILTYGLGSKKTLLDKFRECCLNSCRVLVINGFFPGLTVKEMLSSIFELLGKKSKETAETLFSVLRHRNMPSVFIIIHNIDGPALRQDKIQTFLSQLACCEKVHIVASVDHINAPLLWDQKKSSCFNFIWEECTSYVPYTKENSYESSLMVQNSATLALSSLRNVYRSLNKNSRNIFKLLLENSLSSENKNAGLQFSELYRLCRRNFIVSSDLALRTQLTEFIDHQLVRWKKETDVLTICVDSDVMKTFKEEIDNNTF